ncbi:MAG: DUF308 domain-containing protein [Clostridia bacterium]|nr:DUF308 domain-containing protein [Clostridia bacterium]MBR0219950.1 DUF308 domain-containing protein [Clostridia bacterium]
MNFQSVCKKLKESWIFSAIVIIVLGLVLVLFPAATLSAINYIMGGLAIAMGVIRTVRYFKQDHTYPYLFQSDLVVGLLSVGFGIFMVSQPVKVLSLLPHVFGILMVGFGVGGILRAVDAKKAGISYWGVLLALSILSIVLGWLIMANPFGTMETVTIVIGAGLIYQGVTDIVTVLAVAKRITQWKNTPQQ